MAGDEEDDLYDEEFDFVDDDDDDFEEDSEVETESTESPAKERASDDRGPNNREKRVERVARDAPDDADDRAPDDRDGDVEQAADEEPVDEYGRTAPKADYVVHIYEHEKFKRTIDRPFTPEDAEAFATEYNRTGKSYGRVAVTGKNDGKPKKSLD
jgi:hypothetical protein